MPWQGCSRATNGACRLLSHGGRLPDPDRITVVNKLLPLAQRHGDRDQGRAVFRQQCAVCHHFDGEGGTVGPDLTGFAGGNRETLLIHILDPNRSVEGNYRQYTVETLEGEILSGILKAETKTTLELIDSQAHIHLVDLVARAEIKSLLAYQLSLMPEGFEMLPPQELSSLLENLTP